MFIKTGCCVLSISSPSSGWGMETKTDQSNDSLNSRAPVGRYTISGWVWTQLDSKSTSALLRDNYFCEE